MSHSHLLKEHGCHMTNPPTVSLVSTAHFSPVVMAAASSLTTLSCAGSAEIVPMQRCARILFSANYDIKQEHMSCTKEPRRLMCSSFGWLLLLT